ncbi:HAD family hydrolase [uncultured Limosilactobacillus sp.]|uniref:HAD family hydrolase n=1 Tax=uncultured Limosilactobacillus sp. TaxID=2837629 RepID=UPI0025CCB477|nr:HAD family hydrolase [uncultured Limosilactobacillus sp.]
MNNFMFDFDGTLADSGEVVSVATQKAFIKNNLPAPTKQQILDYMGLPIETFFPMLAPQTSAKVLEQLYADFRFFCTQNEDQGTKFFDGVIPTLQKLHHTGKHLFILSSNSSETIYHHLKRFKIDQLFTEVVGSDMVKNFKPNPESVNRVVHDFNLNRDHSVMIGDARYDLQMGKNAAVKTCGATWGAFNVASLKQERPTYLIDRPQQLLKF